MAYLIVFVNAIPFELHRAGFDQKKPLRDILPLQRYLVNMVC